MRLGDSLKLKILREKNPTLRKPRTLDANRRLRGRQNGREHSKFWSRPEPAAQTRDLGNDANRSVSKVQTEGKESGGVGRGPMGQEGAGSGPNPARGKKDNIQRSRNLLERFRALG